VIDLLGIAMASLRISGATLLHEEYASPWAVSVPSSRELASLLGLGTHRQAIAFHLVRKGGFQLRESPRKPIRVTADEMAIVFGGAPHIMSDGRPEVPRPLEHLIGAHRAPRRISASAEGTRLVCGAFIVEDSELHPLFASLPSVLFARTDSQGGSMLSSSIASLLVSELDRPGPGSTFAVGRLVELLCLEVLRAHANPAGSLSPSFLCGLSDSAVSKAMRVIVTRPGTALSVSSLARAASLSPSRFAARFRDKVGMSPIEFVARWRVALAAQWLSTTDWSVSEISGRVGYESAAAFSRAFSRIAAQSPKSWRQARRAESTAR
jgi:AraC-like DNA-binding protein